MYSTLAKTLQLIVLVLVLGPATPAVVPSVVRYRCIITKHGEILCFEPDTGRMFRPERRFDSFILEVPSL